MTDPAWPVQAGEWSTWLSVNGKGIMLMRNTRPDAEGRFFATEWIVYILPIAPLRRYWVREGETTSKWLTDTTRFEVFGQSRIRLVETLKTYLCWWALVPVVLAPWNHRGELPWRFDDVPNGFGPLVLVACLVMLHLTGWALYGLFLRPVRQAHEIPAAPPPRRPRWPDPEDDMWQ